MKLFNESISQLRDLLGQIEKKGTPCVRETAGLLRWQVREKNNIVLSSDTAVELGNPRHESASFLLWTEKASLVKESTITRIGPGLQDSSGASLPFGKVILLCVEGFNEENCYDRHRELEMVRYNLALKGYMMRAISQYMREWSRVSSEALAEGFDLNVLGNALVEEYRKLDYVRSAEVVFCTSSPEEVRRIREIGDRAGRLIAAMNHMAEEMSFDCASCDYFDICSEVDDLRSLRKTLQKEAG